jgi:hypothetical protein
VTARTTRRSATHCSRAIAPTEIDATRLDDFIAARQVACALWFTGMAQVHPAFATQLDGVHRWSLTLLDRVEPTRS